MRGSFKQQRQGVEPFGMTVDPAPRREDVRRVEEGLDGHAVAQAGVAPPKDVGVYVRNEDGHIVGGLLGVDWRSSLPQASGRIADGRSRPGIDRAGTYIALSGSTG